MAKYLFPLALLLAASLAQAETQTDPDGFTNPMQQLQFNPHLDQREFERSTLSALHVYDPWESWNRRVYHFNYRFDEWVFLPVVRASAGSLPPAVRQAERCGNGNSPGNG